MTTPDERRAREQFASRVFRHLRTAGITNVDYRATDFELHYDDQVLRLGNLFAEFQNRQADEREDWLARTVAAIAAPRSERTRWVDVRVRLRPVLRAAAFLLDDPVTPIRRPWLPFVDEVLAIDLPEMISFPTVDRLAEWGVTAEEAFDTARRNISATIRIGGLAPDTITQVVVNDPSYLPSWLLTPEWLAAATQDFAHRPLVFVPDHTSLVIAPGDPSLIDPLYSAMEQRFRDAARPLSPQAYTLDDDGAVIPFDRVEPMPVAARRARAVLATSQYGAQRESFERQHSDDGVYLSSILSVDRGQGPMLISVWGEGVQAALPETDFVSFQHAGGESITVAFADAVAITGIAPMPDVHPPRYRTNGWPDATVLARLAQAAAPGW
jgi:hypothetical protein